MDNKPPLQDLWREAYNRCLQRLPAKDVPTVLRVNSYHELKESISSSNRKLMNSTVPKALAKIEPFLSSIRQFFLVIDSMVQANPEIAALVWGSIKFLFEVPICVHTLHCLIRCVIDACAHTIYSTVIRPYTECHRTSCGRTSRHLKSDATL